MPSFPHQITRFREADVAVLCARADSVYKQFGNCDVYDAQRDAFTFDDELPVVAHPPCRGWGRLSYFAKPTSRELMLGPFCVRKVRENGGVLEHPAYSKLWKAEGLPRPRAGVDEFGGWTFQAPQFWWGHKCEKLTWFYIVGILPRQLPQIPLNLGEASHVVASSRVRRIDGTRLKKGMFGWRPAVTKAEREHTPPALAEWLCKIAILCGINMRLAQKREAAR